MIINDPKSKKKNRVAVNSKPGALVINIWVDVEEGLVEL